MVKLHKALREFAFGRPLLGTVPSTGLLMFAHLPANIRRLVLLELAGPLILPSTTLGTPPWPALSQMTLFGSRMPPPVPGMCRAPLYFLWKAQSCSSIQLLAAGTRLAFLWLEKGGQWINLRPLTIAMRSTLAEKARVCERGTSQPRATKASQGSEGRVGAEG